MQHIFLGADHRGFELKNQLRDWLKEQKYSVVDLGADALKSDDDYPEYALNVAQAVAEDPDNRRGIVLCGSGVGVAVMANKVPGIRAALVHDPALIEAAQRDDNLNVLALGASFISFEQAKDVISAWLKTHFSGEERHQRRINKIASYENDQEHAHACNCHS